MKSIMSEKTKSLDGLWRFPADPKDCRKEQAWYNGIPCSEMVTVPSVWNTQRGFLTYEGVCCERDIQKTGVQLHTLGHGWMFENWGIHHEPSEVEKTKLAKLTDEQKS